ncbi:2-amino-4-hydroxy-6-hydroxymethyldihydropteridine diphosphokinase [Aliikangiella sp. IMCC44359]|uniref:2-amino-4-hydroxy-6- hydroxymethyldihydropteridine diphosphokinase n=1 Tax=Aliikangiella sp. IMCC44359 TaxID=3459125 RepID=UPI00403AE18D
MIVYLGIGSNIEPHINVAQAKKLLKDIYQHVRFSRTFISQAVGFDGDDFLNLVVEIETNETLPELIDSLKLLEAKLGRVRGDKKFSSRNIDIDILLYGTQVCCEPIVLPRDEIRANAYVLWPLAELAPDLVEPGGNVTYGELWQQFDKTSQQLKPI